MTPTIGRLPYSVFGGSLRSGQAAAWIMTSRTLAQQTGRLFSFNRKPLRKLWEKVFDADIGKAVIDDSLDLLAKCGLRGLTTWFLPAACATYYLKKVFCPKRFVGGKCYILEIR
jgi:hypothetical protein